MKQILFPIIFCSMASALLAGGSPGGPWANGAYYPGQLDGRYSANVYNDAQLGQNLPNTNFYTVQTNLVTNPLTLILTNPVTGAVTVTNFLSTNSVFVTNVIVPSAANVVSGVLGFGLRNGTPATVGASNSSLAAGSSTNNSGYSGISMDNSLNYFVIYVNGDVFAGSTVANINPSSGKIAGALFNGGGRVSYSLFTNQVPGAVGGGAPANSGVTIVSFPGATAGGFFNASVKNSKSPYKFSGKGGITTRATGSGVEGESTYSFRMSGIKSSENSISAYNQTGRNAP